MAKKNQRIPLYKLTWCKIRCWQSLRDISDSELAACLNVCDRTLKEYDKSAKNVTLEKIDFFLEMYGLDMNTLLSS